MDESRETENEREEKEGEKRTYSTRIWNRSSSNERSISTGLRRLLPHERHFAPQSRSSKGARWYVACFWVAANTGNRRKASISVTGKIWDAVRLTLSRRRNGNWTTFQATFAYPFPRGSRIENATDAEERRKLYLPPFANWFRLLWFFFPPTE